MLRSFLSLVTSQLDNFDALIVRIFWVVPTVSIYNLGRPFQDVTFITVQLPLKVLKRWTKRMKITKFWISQEQKEFLGEIISIMHNALSAFVGET